MLGYLSSLTKDGLPHTPANTSLQIYSFWTDNFLMAWRTKWTQIAQDLNRTVQQKDLVQTKEDGLALQVDSGRKQELKAVRL